MVAALVPGLLTAGCSLPGDQVVGGQDVEARVVTGRAVADAVPPDDRALVLGLVDAANRAGDDGGPAQAEFLRATQAAGVDFPPASCFGRVTVRTTLVERTLRPAPDWTPSPGAARPDGAVYVVAASQTTAIDGTVVREDVGSKHVVVRGGRAFGYAPCPD